MATVGYPRGAPGRLSSRTPQRVVGCLEPRPLSSWSPDASLDRLSYVGPQLFLQDPEPGRYPLTRSAPDLGFPLQCSFDRQHVERILLERIGEASELLQSDVCQILTMVQAVSNEPSDDLMRSAERNSLKHQVVCKL